MQGEPTSDLARIGVIVAGKYRLDGLIGRGGMGSVWSATHLGLGHQIAIKLVSREFVRSPAALRRFDAEAKAVARLQSRHVVQVYDNGTLDDGTPYIAMELLAGESLQQRVDRAGPFSVRETVNILGQCCKALGRAHANGVVHRDIKPDNIFLARSADEDEEVIKILDFGVAKVALGTGTDGDQSTTKTGSVLGTPLYMSPEQARGLKSVDHRTDLYSLGLVTYTMLTGRDAFEGESFGDILIKICVDPLPRLSAAAAVPPSLDRWFEHTCARDPAERCASAQEFIDTLRQASEIGVSGPPQFVPAPVAATITDLPPPPPRFAISVPSVANVSMTAAGVPRNSKRITIAVAIISALVVLGGVAALFIPPHRGDTHTPATPGGALTPSAAALSPSAIVPPTGLAPPPTEPALVPLVPAETSAAQPGSKNAVPSGGPGAPPPATSAGVSATPIAPVLRGGFMTVPTVASADRHAATPTAPPHALPPHPPATGNPGAESAGKPPAPQKIDLGY